MTRTRPSLIASLVLPGLLAGAVAFASSVALAAGGGGDSSGGTSTPSCPSGFIWNAGQGKCVKSTSSNLDDKTLFTQGRNLALAGRYAEALTALNAVKAPDSMVLTMIGYAERKSGNYDRGLAFYRQALTLDPDNVNTHEYLGEAYAEKGQLDLAKAELAKVEAVCGTACEQYQDLAAAIAGKPNES